MYKLHPNIIKFYENNTDKWRIRHNFFLDIVKSLSGEMEYDKERIEHLSLKAFNFGLMLDENDIEEFLKTGTICMK